MPLRLTTVGQALLDSAAPPETNRPSAFFAGLGLLCVIAALDFVAGRELSLTALYLVPIVVTTWNVGRTAGLTLAVTSAVLSIAGKLAAGVAYSSWLVPATSCLLWTALFVAFVLVLTQLRRALDREKALARVDPLTGVSNRRHFVEVAAVELSRAHRHARPLTVAYLDLDNFKQVNDQLGHDVGDGLLLTVTRTMRARLRLTDEIGRMGGTSSRSACPRRGPRRRRPSSPTCGARWPRRYPTAPRP